IKVLEGLEAVRKRPHMYIRGVGAEGLHHLVYEVVDNSVDEALAGHAKVIKLTIHANGSLSVEDDGRGIPVGPHPTESMDTLDVLSNRMRELAFLNPGLRIVMRDERSDKSHDFKYEGGILAYVELLNTNKTTVFDPPITVKGEINGSEVHVALQWNDGFDEKVF